jgi:hypothetical protein
MGPPRIERMPGMNTDWVAAQHGPLRPLAYLDLNERPGFKLALVVRGDRWYLFVSHLWHSGWSLVNVTDPGAPKLERFIPGPANTWTLQVTVNANLLATSLEKIHEGWGDDPTRPHDEGIILWDIEDPLNPRQRAHFRTGGTGTHRNLLDKGGSLHASAWMAGYAGAIYVLIDVADPDNPREVGRYFEPGQEGGADGQRFRYGLHGPAMRVGDIAYLPYSEAGLVILDLSRPEEPRAISRLHVRPPLGSAIAVHTALPLIGRNLVVINSEALAERCAESVGYAGIVDVSDIERPTLISLFPTPSPPPGSSFHSFCERGGRFGPHNQHMVTDDPNLYQSDGLTFLTYFNAGLRVFDIADPYRVEEVAYLIPKDPVRRLGPLPSGLVTQVEDVLVDARGIAYFTEKNSGLYVAEWKA